MKIKMSDEELVDYVVTARNRGKSFRDNFQEDVDKCVENYNCTHPSEWSKKEDWQSKIFIPLAYKNVEVGSAMMAKMLIAQKDFFEISGFDPEENDLREALAEFVVHVLQKGNYYNIVALALKEASIASTCFIKTVDVSKDKNDFTLNFIPRTFHDVVIDPSVSFYWTNSRFVVDEYEKDIADIISNPIYNYGKKYFEDIKGHTSESKSIAGQNRDTLENISEAGADATYKPHSVIEFHGKVKDPETQEDVEMVLTVCDERWLIRKEEVDETERAYDVIRVNPIPKQFYGAGLVRRDNDIQTLANGVVNLWFDNWKLSAMKMIAVDPAGDVKWETVKFGPANIWEVGKGAITPIEVGMPVDGMAALGILDQISQETTGVTKVSQGQQTPGSDETLGEVQIKLSRSDARFVQMAKFIEAEFLGSHIKKVINYIIKNCPQEYVNKIMGFKTVTRKILFMDKKVRTPRLDLEFIRKNYGKDVALDFRPIGISRFMNQSDEQARYKELLQAVLANETLGMMFDIKKLVKRSLHALGFEEIDQIMRSEDELEALMTQMTGGQPQMPQGGGMPAMPGEMPQPAGVPAVPGMPNENIQGVI